MHHSITKLNDALIKIVFDGDIDKYRLLKLCKEVEALTNGSDNKDADDDDEDKGDKKLNFIADISSLGHVTAEARHLFAAYNQKKHIGKAAVSGFDQGQKILAHFILVESNRNNIYFFDTVSEAEAWLIGKYS